MDHLKKNKTVEIRILIRFDSITFTHEPKKHSHHGQLGSTTLESLEIPLEEPYKSRKQKAEFSHHGHVYIPSSRAIFSNKSIVKPA